MWKHWVLTNPTDVIKERYTKFAKTIVQVGKTISDNVTKPVGHRVEIVPTQNPAQTKKGGTLTFLILMNGDPLPDQNVVFGREPGAFKNPEDTILVIKSDSQGMLNLPITHEGLWWVHFINIQPADEDDEMDFVSLWSSLTFRI